MTITLAPAINEVAPLTLDERLALTGLTMDDRLNRAGIAHDVRTAPIEIPEILTDPQPVARPARPATADEVLAEAGRLIAAHGWMQRWLTNGVAMCTKGAIQAAAGGEGSLADEAEALLLDRIRAEQPDILSIGAWNDAQTGDGPVLRMLGG